MSVIVIGRFKADPAALKKLFAERAADFIAVSEESKGLGAIHHRFGAGDGEVLVLDEWDSAESFQKFFEGNTTIPEILQAANVQGPPEFVFFEALDSPDQF
jgi:heme-degrading monooxygenase HmoA